MLVCCSIFLCRAKLHDLHNAGTLPDAQTRFLWLMLGVLNGTLIGALLMYLVWMHSVLRFTKK